MHTARTPLVLFFVCDKVVTSLSRDARRLVYSAIEHWLRMIDQPLIDCYHSGIAQVSVFLVTHICRHSFNRRSWLTKECLLDYAILSASGGMRILLLLHAPRILLYQRQSLLIIHPMPVLIALF